MTGVSALFEAHSPKYQEKVNTRTIFPIFRMPVKDAKQVTIELSKLNWELMNLGYRFEWDDPAWPKDVKKNESRVERIRLVQKWKKKKSQYLESISRRVKYEALMDRVVAKGHLGKVGFKTIYDMDPGAGLDVNYEVLSTRPGGEVRVNEETRLKLRESNKTW